MGAAAIRIIQVPAGLPEGWDAADAAAEGWSPEAARRWLAANVRTVAEVGNLDEEPAQRELAPRPTPSTAPSHAERVTTHQPGAPAVATTRRAASTELPNREEPPRLAEEPHSAATATHTVPLTRGPSAAVRPVASDDPYLDSKAPLASAKRFLTGRVDGDDLPDLVRWQESYWRAEGARYVTREAEKIASDLYDFLQGKWDSETNLPIKPTRRLVENIEHALRAAALREIEKAPAWLDGPRDPAATRVPAEEILAFRNGLLHLPTRRWSRPTRRFFNLNAVGFDYDARAPEPASWLQFLEQLWPDDAESIETLQESFGLALTANTSHQKMFLLIGPKRCGKGTLLRVLTRLVGVENVSAPTLSGLAQNFGLESLIGKTIATISDARLGGRVDLSVIVENLLRISGEDAISVPRKHRVDWTSKLSVRFFIISNELPNFSDASGALASRFVVLRLARSFFGEEDLGLLDRLLPELPGILLWSLAGLERLRARGYFRQPVSARGLVQDLADLSSPVDAFIAERCVLAPGASVGCSALFSAWQEWCRQQGRDHPGTAPVFGRNLSAARSQIHVSQRRTDEGRVRHYEGIRLRGPYESEEGT